MNSPLKVLLDSNGLQISTHLGIHHNKKFLTVKGKRLGTFISIIESLGCEILFTEGAGIDISENILFDCSVFIMTTRTPDFPEQTEREIYTIKKFVERGGGLLIMSNHPFLNKQNRIPDKKIASRFNIELEGPIYPTHGGKQGLTEIYDKDLHKHPINDNLKGPIVFNNSCRIRSKVGDVIVTLPGEENNANNFAVAIDEEGKGRIVITADSGFIGNNDTNLPGKGLIEKGENKKFIKQTLEWLLKKR